MTARLIITTCLILYSYLAVAQNYRWQQEVNYYMEVEIDAKSHQFQGDQRLVYTNNSPDTLKRVFYHLYFNAFRPGSMMDVRSRTIADPDSRVIDRIARLQPDEIGYLKVNQLSQDNRPLDYETVGTILEVTLSDPLLPGDSTRLTMEFEGQVPLQIRRSGRENAEGIAYSMSQWYPKLSEYDHRGWHSNPYVGREFHGVWGDFEVKLTIDKEYVVAATGYLQNPQEVGHGYAESASHKSDKLTWHFKAPNVHDFVWAADPNYRHVQAEVPNGPTLHFFYQPGQATKHWEKLPEYTVKAFQYANKHFGKYPYDQYSVIQGGDGGMEYPMATLITGHRSLRSLVGVTVHELMHSWYQMVLATNESLYAWMDEGFTSFAATEIMDYLFEENKKPYPQLSHYNSYFNLVSSGLEEPMTTHADHFRNNHAYSVAAYSKGSVFLRQLSYIIGEQALRKGLIRYFNEWKFRHPEPQDFIRTMEKTSGLELDWYLEHWINTTKTIDYGIHSLEAEGDSTTIILQRYGDMMMPIDLSVVHTDGTREIFHIPLVMMRGSKPQEDPDTSYRVLNDWAWTHPRYRLGIPVHSGDLKKVEIDPTRRLADVLPGNNSVEVDEYFKEKNP